MIQNHFVISLLLWHCVFCLAGTLHLISIFKSPIRTKKQEDAHIKIEQGLEILRHGGIVPEKWVPTVFIVISFLTFFFTFVYIRRVWRDFINLFKKKSVDG